MNKYFSPEAMKTFEVFSNTHFLAIVIIIFFNFFIYFLFKKKYSFQKDKYFRITLGIILLLAELSLILWYIFTSQFDMGISLPFHLCRLANIFIAVMLFLDSRKLYKIMYFIGLGASLPALITPDLPYNFPHFGYIKFFIGHGGMLTAVLYMTAIKKYRPDFKSVIKTFIYLNVAIPFIALINIITGGNYFYLSHKPSGFSLMNFLNEWPWYILNIEIIVFIIFIIFYIPFLVNDHLIPKINFKENFE